MNKYRSARLEPFSKKYIAKHLVIPIVIVMVLIPICYALLNTPQDIRAKQLNSAINSEMFNVSNKKFDFNLKSTKTFFSLTDSHNNIFNSSQLIGKTVWLSFFCLDDFKSHGEELGQFIRQNRNSNIEFVTIFLGRDTINWRFRAQKHAIEGIHLKANKSINKLIKQFGIKSTPHFAILSKKGSLLGSYLPFAEKSIIPDYILYCATQGITATNAVLNLYNETYPKEHRQWISRRLRLTKTQKVK